jgi:cytochrome c oxidase assembly protein subunit 15
VPDWPKTFGRWFFPIVVWISGGTGDNPRLWDMFLEHGHRMIGQIAGIVVIMLAIAVCWSDPRKWMRWMALAAVLGVILQGTLGGLRVLADARLLARVHGCTAPLFFALCAAMVSATSPAWLAEDGPHGSTGAAQFPRFLWAICAAIYAEIALGTLLRVPSFAVGGNWFQLVVWAKVLVAGTIAALLAWLWIHTRAGALAAPTVRRRARLLAALFAVQIALACGTWVTHYGWPEWFIRCFGDVPYTVVETGRWQIALTTLHVGAGSLCLALAVSTALWSHRLLRDLPP